MTHSVTEDPRSLSNAIKFLWLLLPCLFGAYAEQEEHASHKLVIKGLNFGLDLPAVTYDIVSL